MKKIIAALVIACSFQIADAQLANTSWTGSIETGNGSMNSLWKITADTSYFYNSDDNTLLDVSVFKVQDSTVSIRRVSGESSCGEEVGLYKFTVINGEFKLYLIKDDCADRAGALDKNTFKQKK